MNNKLPPLKRGQPKKLNRNLLICKLVDEQKMTLKEIADQYNMTRSRAGQIIDKFWKTYQETKQD